jgi:hypothetical protein
MTKELEKQLQDKFLGKRIRIPWVNPSGMGTNQDTITGICNFIGINENFPTFGLQVTIERTPIRDVDHTKIQLV